MEAYAQPMAAPPLDSLHRFSYEDVLAMEEAGLIGEGQHVELEGGLLVERPVPGPEHDDCVEWLMMHFVRAAGDAYRVRVQSTFRIPDGGYYEPDIMVIAPLPRGEQPWSAQLVVEVAVSARARTCTRRRWTRGSVSRSPGSSTSNGRSCSSTPNRRRTATASCAGPGAGTRSSRSSSRHPWT